MQFMEKPMTTIDALYASRTNNILESPDYKFTKQNAPILNKPIFTIQDLQTAVTGISYKKVNDWDEKNLISCSRETKDSGWRRFSIIDTVKLSIISDLRKFDFVTETIKAIVDSISSQTISVTEIKTGKTVNIEFLGLEHSIFSALNGDKLLLIVNENAKAYLLTEKEFAFFHFFSDSASTPIVILPFFSYIQKIATAKNRNLKINGDSTISGLFNNQLTDQEKEILKIIRDKAYEEITTTKKDGNKFVIRAKGIKKGSFTEQDVIDVINSNGYQNVTVSMVDGQKVTIIKEQTIKV